MNDRQRARSKQHRLHDGAFDYTLPRPPALGEECVSTATEAARMEPISKSSFKEAHRSRPKYVTWAESLHHLLQDPEGVKFFRKYLENEGPEHANPLHFWFACEGLRKHEHENVQKLVKLIYKRYILKFSLPIDDELRKHIAKKLKSSQCLEPPITLFDEAHAQIESLISKTTYPNFLKSDVYLQYIQSVESASNSDDSESSASFSPVAKDIGNLASGGPLPTLHEDMELSMHAQPPLLITPGTGSVSTGYHTPTPRLTKDMLLRSQKHRALDIRPKSEAYAGLIYRSNGAHIAYNSFNPVSRQDSEMQSLSSHSDARTESDCMSLQEREIEGGCSTRSSHEKQIRQLAARNRETEMHHSYIPRTLRCDWESKGRPRTAEETAEHAALIIEKLERVQRDRDSQELLRRRLREGESLSSLDEKQALSKLTFHDDSDQDILDEHVSRVFSDHSSQDLASPKPSSSPPPPRGGWSRGRRERDLFSTFSADSGNVRDYSEEERRSRRAPSGAEPDSGVSVASEGVVNDSRVISWLRKAERSGGRAHHAVSEMGAAAAPRHVKRGTSRSNSLERPAQPFIADPSMPPLPLPDTDVQLEEIRRRLTEDDGRTRSKQRSSNKFHLDLTQSGQSTLRKSMRGQKPFTEEITVAVFSFDDEQIPYRIKIPGTQITLRQFKDLLPKKGNYRFFFKTLCEDLCNQATNEEVSNDNEVLPLWEGKIIAQMKPTD